MIHSIGHKSLSGTYAVNAPVMTKRAGRLESVVLELFTRSANVLGVEGVGSNRFQAKADWAPGKTGLD